MWHGLERRQGWLGAEEQKRRAGERASQLVEDGMTVGLGSGTTALAFVEALGQRVRNGLAIRAVSSSERTSEAARRAGIEIVPLEGRLDLVVDGADVIERGSLGAIKGLGGALTREKLVVLAAERFVLIGDASKVVDHFDESKPGVPVPIEVVPFGWKLTRHRFSRLGEPRLRESSAVPYVTDNGNLILDLFDADYSDPPALGRAIKEITGVVEHGMFLGMATLAIIAVDDGVEELTRA